MVAKIHAGGGSFAGVAKYCLHDAPEPDEAERPESADRVEWAETRNLASRPERAAGQMAATANAAPELKRLTGVSAAGRKLTKPVVHYTLSWAKDERPDRAEMNRAADQTLKALGMERHQALLEKLVEFEFDPYDMADTTRERVSEYRLRLYRQNLQARIMPVFSRLMVDETGWLWAELYRFDVRAPVRWLVFAPNGEGHGSVDMPPDLEVWQIGRDFVLGVWQDEHEVEYVRRHALRGQR